MNNMRRAPNLIDPRLLGKVNKVYIGKQSQNNFILEWLYNRLYPYFKDNMLFSIIIISLIIFLMWRYLDTLKRKNKIIENINDDKPIDVKLDKPINYSEKYQNSESSAVSNLSNISNIKGEHFEKDVERNLQMGNNQMKGNQQFGDQYIQQPQQMGQQIMPQSGCFRGNGSLTSTVGRNEYFEPTANNAYSDNFQDYNLL
jgi:hypothetical protein